MTTFRRRLAPLLFAAVVGGCDRGGAEDVSSGREQVVRAIEQMESGDPRSALAVLEEVGAEETLDHYLIQSLRADALTQLEDYEGAFAARRKAIQVAPGNLGDYVDVAELNFRMGKLEDAIAVLNGARPYLYPVDSTYQAIEDVDAALSAPEEVRYYLLLIGLHRALQQNDAAMSAAMEGVLRNTSSVPVFDKTMELLLEAGKTSTANRLKSRLCDYLAGSSEYCGVLEEDLAS